MRQSISIFAAFLGFLVVTPPALADASSPAPPKAPQCFQVSNFENWKAGDAKTIYIRVNLHQYYRLDLASTCPALLWPGAYLVTEWHGSSSVCTALDWDLTVAQNPGGISSPCIVKTMTPLTAEEAAAIPKASKP